VIGGGVNGAGIARDAAGRGAQRAAAGSAAIWRSGTSSASTKLIHGGLRYLEHYEFALVHESLAEREALWADRARTSSTRCASCCPMQEACARRGCCGWACSSTITSAVAASCPRRDTVASAAIPPARRSSRSFGTGFEYSDGWVDDARLVVLNARTRANTAPKCAPARPSPPPGAKGALAARDARRRVPRRRAGQRRRAGVLDVMRRTGDDPALTMRLVRGSHIVVAALFDHDYAYFFQLPDGRIFFAIPMSATSP
jgi:glycerol-3-phosphate dehydrogenase